MSMNPPTMGRSGGGGFVDRIHGEAKALLALALFLGAMLVIAAAIFMAVPGNPAAAAMNAWIAAFITNLVNKLILLVIGGSAVTALVGGVLYHFSHHEHGRGLVRGAGIAVCLAVVARVVVTIWPHLLATGTFS